MTVIMWILINIFLNQVNYTENINNCYIKFVHLLFMTAKHTHDNIQNLFKSDIALWYYVTLQTVTKQGSIVITRKFTKPLDNISTYILLINIYQETVFKLHVYLPNVNCAFQHVS